MAARKSTTWTAEPMQPAGEESRWVIKNASGGVEGFMTKFPDTRTDTHPYRIYARDWSVRPMGYSPSTFRGHVYGTAAKALKEAVTLIQGPSRNPPRRRRTSSSRTRGNPPLVVFGNPRGATRGAHILSREIHAIKYKHASDGKLYEHKFARGSAIELLPDGSIRVFSPTGVRLWNDF